MEENKIKYDVDGYDAVTAALRELLNQFPGLLQTGDEISFSTLGEDSGKTMYPISGAVIEQEQRFILGDVRQICQYPFHVIYRAAGLSENRKAAVKEWLDNLGRWLEGQTVKINGEEHHMESYPPLSDNRRFISIARQTPAYLSAINDNNSEDWAIYIMARYSNEFRENVR